MWFLPWTTKCHWFVSLWFLVALISLQILLFFQVIKLHIDLLAEDSYLLPASSSLQYLTL